MNLKNIILKTAELGPVNWENVEKLQPSNDGFILFVDYEIYNIDNQNGEAEQHLLGYYIQTEFNYKPNYKEVINYIIQKEYPYGKENQMLRYGVYDPNDEEYLEYYNHAEEISNEIKSLIG